MTSSANDLARRRFLRLAAGAALAVPDAGAAADRGRKRLGGIFPIAQTPFTDDGKLDLDVLVEEVRFLDRGGVHGFVWPQLASEWATLTEDERLAGMEAVAAAGKSLRTAIVLGVQAADATGAVRYARHARKAGADALIALPPPGQADAAEVTRYFQEIGKATGLPLFLQAVGNVGIDLIAGLVKAVPTLRYVKDEAGQPLMRIAPLKEKIAGEVHVFSGGHGRTLIDEMERGFAGSMPAASFADLYAAVWDAWQAGKRREAMEIFARTAMLIHEISVYGIESLKYILCLRGVFKNTHIRGTQRGKVRAGEDLAGLGSRSRLDETARKVIRDMLEAAKPYLRA